MATPTERWLPLHDPRPDARMRLFVFPYAGGRASAFRGWSRKLPAWIEVAALQPPGREQRLSEPPLESVAAAVAAIAPVIEPLLDRPCAFLGHSLGGLVAYETQRALARRGAPLPVRFFASGSRAPHAPLPEDPIHVLRGDAFLERLRALGGTPPEVLACREIIDLFTPMLLADFRMSETYRCADPEPLAMPLTVLGGRADREVARERLELWTELRPEAEVAWFEGGHFFLHVEEDAVLARIAAELAAAAR